jgi:excinuclease ABC subunit B
MGRASRHVEGRAILYADRITDSMRRAMDETDRRRRIQRAYNEEHGITPQSIINKMDMGLAAIMKAEYGEVAEEETVGLPEFATQAEIDAFIARLETEMREAAKKFEFERAARLRDTIKELREKELL